MSDFRNIRADAEPAVVIQKVHSFTSAQILALHLAPYELVPNPGAEKTIKPLAITIFYTYGGTVYTNTQLDFKINTLIYCSDFNTIAQTANRVRDAGISSQVNTFTNYPLVMVGSPATGNGTMVVTVTYCIIPSS